MARLQDQVIIVTGGGNGIGRAYCQGLAQEGARVVVADIDGRAADGVAQSLGEDGWDALAVVADVSDPQATDDMARAALDRFGRIDGLINNAAVFQRPAMSRVPFEEIPVDEWDRLMAVNLRGLFLCCRAVVPHMKQQGSGKIVNISSGTVFAGSALRAHYVTSKAGVLGLTRWLATWWAKDGVRVNCVTPGGVFNDHDPAFAEAYGNRTPMGRMADRDELVGMVLFLLSDASSYCTGQNYIVDGGFTAW